MKTYAHPTGGTVTTDIVNDVIRSVAVPPVFGAPKPIYQKIKITKDEPPNYFVQVCLNYNVLINVYNNNYFLH